MRLSSLLIIVFVVGNSFSYGNPNGSDSLKNQADTQPLFNRIHWSENKPDSRIFDLAIQGYEALQDSLGIFKKPLLTIIDFSRPSNVERLWVIDLDTHEVLFNTLVAHGRNSGEITPTRFSNKHNSFQSSLGFYVTGYTYYGKHGRSLTLNGLEPGINDHAERRAIVVHGAEYVSEGFIKHAGRLGRSQGCPAVSMKVYEPLIKVIQNQSCLFIYAPDEGYMEQTQLIKSKDKNEYYAFHPRETKVQSGL
jgi:hypothetical protein